MCNLIEKQLCDTCKWTSEYAMVDASVNKPSFFSVTKTIDVALSLSLLPLTFFLSSSRPDIIHGLCKKLDNYRNSSKALTFSSYNLTSSYFWQTEKINLNCSIKVWPRNGNCLALANDMGIHTLRVCAVFWDVKATPNRNEAFQWRRH